MKVFYGNTYLNQNQILLFNIHLFKSEDNF